MSDNHSSSNTGGSTDPTENAFAPRTLVKPTDDGRSKSRFNITDVLLSAPVKAVPSRASFRQSTVLVAQQIHEAREAKKKEEVPENPIRYMRESSFFIFSPANPVRARLFRLVHWRWFRRFIALVIILNMCVLAAYDPTNLAGLFHLRSPSPAPVAPVPIPTNDTAPISAPITFTPGNDTAPTAAPVQVDIPTYTTRNYILDIIDLVCLVIYTVEAILKLIVMGAIAHKGAYFRNGWNILDFLIITLSYIALGVGPALGVFKIARVLRPLRLLNVIKQLRRMVNAMVKSIPYLANVVLLMLLFFILFGLTGVEMWGGALQRHCYDNSTGTPVLIGVDTACKVTDSPEWLGGYYCDVKKQQVCGRSIELSGTVLNPNVGMTHFDNFGAAILALFQSVTLEGWIVITYWMQDASVDVAGLYFILIPIFGSFFFMNLFLATVQDSYSRSTDDFDADDDDAVEDPSADQENPGAVTNKTDAFSKFIAWLKRPTDEEIKTGSGCWNGLLKFASLNCKYVLERDWFKNTRDAIIIINTLALGLKYYDMSPTLHSAMKTINLVCLIIYSIELFYALVMKGIYSFMYEEYMNPFDLLMVIVSWIQYALSGGALVGAISVFRIFRTLRLFTYIKSWRRANKMSEVVPKIFPFLFYSLVLLAVITYIFAVLGMQLLGGKYTPDKFPEKPRLHYDSFWVAFVSTFTVITFENWNGQMYDAVKASGSPAIALYFVAIIFAGNYLVLNLFLSIILNAFGDAVDGDDEPAKTDSPAGAAAGSGDSIPQENAVELNLLDATGQFVPTDATKGVSATKTINGKEYEFVDLDRGFNTLGGKQKVGRIYDKSLFMCGPNAALRRYAYFLTTSNIFIYVLNALLLLSLITLMVETYYPNPLDQLPVAAPVAVDPPANVTEAPVDPPSTFTAPVDPPSLFTAPVDPPSLFTAPVDPPSIFAAPLANATVPVAAAPSLAPSTISKMNNYSKIRSFLFIIDIVYAVVFGLEVILKVIALGFVGHPRAYLRNFVNVFDLVSEVIMIVDVATWGLGFRLVKALRATRPIRLLLRLKQTRIIFQLFGRTLPALPSVLPIGLMVWISFAILGTQLYSGRFSSCTDPTILTRDACNGTFINEDGDVKLREWESPNDNYNHFFHALFTIFKKSTGESWPDVMFSGIDAPPVQNVAPERGRDPLNMVFFIAQMALTAWFVLGLVFGVIVDTFNDLRRERVISKHAGELLITDEQRQWVELQSMMVGTLPERFRHPPTNQFQRFFHVIATSKVFENIMLVVIGLNTLFLCFNIYVQSDDQKTNPWRVSQTYADYVFTSIYILELLIKLFAFDKYYFYEGWNILDAIIVVVSVVGWFVTFANLGKTFRVLRTLRVFKVTKSIKTLRILWRSMLRSLPALGNVLLLLFLTLCAFAEVGCVLFRNLPEGDELNRRANFDSFWSALLLLLRCATGEAWDTLMHDVMRETSDWACIYFILFVIYFNFIFINVFTAVVVDSFQSVSAIDEHEVTIDDVEKFTTVWSRFDQEAIGRIHVTDLPPLAKCLGKPLGLKTKATDAEVKAFINSLHLPVRRQYIYFPEALLLFAKNAIGVAVLPNEVILSVATKWNKKFQKRHARRETDLTRLANVGVPLEDYERPSERIFTLQEVLAAIAIQRAFRGSVVRRQKTRRRSNGTSNNDSLRPKSGFQRATPKEKERVTTEMETNARSSISPDTS